MNKNFGIYIGEKPMKKILESFGVGETDEKNLKSFVVGETDEKNS